MSNESAIFPTQHGAMTYAAFTSTHLSIAASLAPPHACSATPTSKSSSKSSMNPSTHRTLRRPAAAALLSATSSDRALASTSTNVASGK